MMRSPGLVDCLESPLLWQDAAAATLVAKDLENAEKFLKDAPGKKDAIDQLNTAYQSMYFASQALLHSASYKSAGFRCVVTVLDEFYVKKGKLEKAHVENLLRAQRLEGAPAENIALAAGFLDVVKKALGK